MTALNRKLVRDLWEMKGQALAICLVIACGVATFVMSLSTLSSLKNTQEAYYDRYRFAHVFAHLKRAPNTLAERIATDMRTLPGVTDTLTTIGGGQQEQVNVASIYVKLTPIEERKIAQQDLMVRARNEVLGKYQKLYPGQLRTSVQQVAAISGGGFRNADIQYVIGGPELDKLQETLQGIYDEVQ